MRTKTITQTGYVITGTAKLLLWGGGTGEIEMSKQFIPIEKFNKTNMLRSINDGGFGCEKILSADIDIYIRYNDGSQEFDRTIYDVDSKHHTTHFLGWQELKKQGIN
jgi:hypothetical protein